MSSEQVSASSKGSCWSCGHALDSSDYGRRDSCPKCGRDTHVCMNCDFHDRSFNNECREPQADRVVDKEKSNFCDYFRSKTGSGGSGPSKGDLLSAAEALFRKK